MKMIDGQKTIALPIIISADSIPEFDEKFSITLKQVSGGAAIGSLSTCQVTIMENDYPYGLIGNILLLHAYNFFHH